MFPYFWIFVVGYLEPFHSFSTLIITKNWGNNEHIHFGILKLKLRNWLKTPVNHLTNIGIFSAYINLFTQPGWKKPAQCFSVTWDCLLDPQAPTTTGHVRPKWWTNKKSFCRRDFCCLSTWNRWAEIRPPSRFLRTALLQAGALRCR